MDIGKEVNNVEEVEIDISPEKILQAVQLKRMRMLLEYEGMDKNKRYLMNELAETAVQCRKIESDETIADGEQTMGAELARAIMGLGSNPFKVDGSSDNINRVLVEPEIADITPLPGEDGLLMEDLNYNDYIEDKKQK